jgi:hypothetical protein
MGTPLRGNGRLVDDTNKKYDPIEFAGTFLSCPHSDIDGDLVLHFKTNFADDRSAMPHTYGIALQLIFIVISVPEILSDNILASTIEEYVVA